MKLTTTHLTNDKGGGANSFNTASISPLPNHLIIAVVLHQASDTGSPAANQPSISGCGLTWTLIATQQNTTDSTQRVSVFKASGAAVSGQLTISFGGQTQMSAFWGVTQFNFANTTGSNAANAIVQSATKSENTTDPMSMTLTLSAFENNDNAIFAACIGPDTLTLPSGFTNIFTDTQDLGPDNSVRACWKDSPSTSTLFTSTGSGAGVSTGLAIEIRRSTNYGSGIAVMF